MKKIIALALSILLGSTGYAIVDHTLEGRVDTLEVQVESLNGVVSSLERNHISGNSGQLPNTIPPVTITFPSATTTDTTTRVYTYTQEYTLNGWHKDYNYGYLKIKIPNVDGSKCFLFASSFDSNIQVRSNDVFLDGSEYSILIGIQKNSAGTFRLKLSMPQFGSCDYCECTVSEKDGNIYVSKIFYSDNLNFTTTTTTTTTFGEVTTN